MCIETLCLFMSVVELNCVGLCLLKQCFEYCRTLVLLY